jgi:hypothetical protein
LAGIFFSIAIILRMAMTSTIKLARTDRLSIMAFPFGPNTPMLTEGI